MRVKLREFDLEGMARALDKGIVDLGITYDVGLPETVAWETMLSYAPHAVVPPDSPLAAKKSVTLAELARYPFILVDLPLSREFLLVPFWQQGLSPNIALRTTSVEMVRGMVANGLGVSLLFTRPGHDFSHDGRKVVCLPIEDETLRQRLVLAYPSGGPATLTAQEAMPVIRDCFAARSFQAAQNSAD
jgi:DNA-binding transcriptional LysR family regulator